MKIKLTEKEKEFNGILENGKVTLFGTSAHIPFKRKHLGKIVKIIIPEETEYIWLLNKEERKKFIELVSKVINKTNTKMTFYNKEHLESLKKEKFSIDDLEKTIYLLENSKINDPIIKKIKKLYNLE